MRISDWSSDVVLFRSWLDNAPADRKPIPTPALPLKGRGNSLGWKKNGGPPRPLVDLRGGVKAIQRCGEGQRHAAMVPAHDHFAIRSEEHTSELQSLMRISYAVFCLKKKKQHTNTTEIKQRR